MSVAWARALKKRLDELQAGLSSKYIVYEPAPTGLGGQFTGRITALLTGLATDRGVIFPRLDDPPYVQSFEQMSAYGVDYQKLEGKLDEVPDLMLDGSPQEDSFVRLSPYRTSLSAGHIRAAICDKLKAIVESDSLTIEWAEGCIKDWMVYTREMKSAIEAKMASFDIDEKCLGVHVRRGDKQIESAFVPLEAIQDIVKRLVHDGQFSSVFLATDSADVIRSFATPSGVKLIFDTGEKRYNNANHKMLFSKQDMAHQETLTALTNIEALSRCGGIVGQDNAHFSTIAASSITCRIGDRFIYLLPGDYAEQRSPLVRIVFTLKRKARLVARTAMPWATSAARVKKL